MCAARTARCTSRRSRRSSISPTRKLRVGTRGSSLALTQADMACEALRGATSDPLDVEVVTIKTIGDRVTDKPFNEIGPKGVFAAELQRAVLDGTVDIAVHSAKDLQSAEPEGLAIAAYLEREDARDVLVSRDGRSLADLDAGAVVGTSSVRRQALVHIVRPDLRTTLLRGNVPTRIGKVRDGEMDAAILAAAGLVRLGETAEITEWLDPAVFTPPPGQGAIALECHRDRLDGDLAWVRDASHEPTERAVTTERTLTHLIEGGCDVPLGAWARIDGEDIVCEAFVAAPDGSAHLRDTARGTDPHVLGTELGQRLLDAGAAALARPG